LVKEALPEGLPLTEVDIWFQDESRVGQQGSQTRIWAPTGSRPRVVKQQQFLYQYIFGAVCPAQQACAAIVVPYANQQALAKHLEEISYHVPKGRHAVVVMDQAGWQQTQNLTLPNNISVLHIPPYSPELNPQEQVWLYLKNHFLANRVYQNLDNILNACCNAWNQFAHMPNLIQSLTTRNWALLTS
jgi:hypothetical protein